jgi:hypothetical protein
VGGAKLSFGAQLVKRLGLGSSFEASGSGGDNSDNTFDLVGTNSIPVAFAPAFVVTATKQAANGQVKYEIAHVNDEVVEKKSRIARQSQGSIRHIMEARAPRMPSSWGVRALVLQDTLTGGHIGHIRHISGVGF